MLRMALVVDLSVFIVSCAVLIFLGGLLVRSLTKLASFLRVGDFVIATLIMAVSTSLPELFVGISSALAGTPAIALGNVIGSNIADLTLVAGIVALLGRGLKVSHRAIKKDAYLMVIIAVLPIVLMGLGRQLSRVDGIILVSVIVLYFAHLIGKKRKLRDFREEVSRWGVIGHLIVFLAALPLLFLASKYVVESGTALAFDLALPAMFVGLFFLAIGTSLPELTFQARAVLRGARELALGDLIGSVIANSTLVLGVTAIITPITANFFLFLTSSVFMIIVCFMFAVFLESGRGIHWKEGLILLMMYVLFLLVEFTLKDYYVLNSIV